MCCISLSVNAASVSNPRLAITLPNQSQVVLTDDFWKPKIQIIKEVTIPHAFDKCNKEGRLENFLIAGGVKSGKTQGKFPFDDTDVYKIIEGASYCLMNAHDSRLESLPSSGQGRSLTVI